LELQLGGSTHVLGTIRRQPDIYSVKGSSVASQERRGVTAGPNSQKNQKEVAFVRKGTTIVLLLALVIVLVFAATASASYVAGNTRSTGYGVRATIACPSSAPYVGGSGQASWVSTPGPSYWIQTGWRYWSGYSNAKSYYEYSLPIGYSLVETGTHSWGGSRTYEVSHSGSGVWAVKINGATVGSWGTLSAPVSPVRAMTETHYPTVQMNTQFSSVKYRGTTTWYNFDQGGWVTNSPY
jgi:hypothetical protein